MQIAYCMGPFWQNAWLTGVSYYDDLEIGIYNGNGIFCTVAVINGLETYTCM